MLMLWRSTATAEVTQVYSVNRGVVVNSSDSQPPRPMASLTKIMTAIVAYEHNPNLAQPMTAARGTRLPPGPVTRGDLFASVLVKSDNAAAEQLARDYPGGRTAFVQAMNRRAQELGLTHTRFADASGLDRNNVSTASEVVVLVMTIAQYPELARLSVLSPAVIETPRQRVTLLNTNRDLLDHEDHVLFSKTGFTQAAGRCVALLLNYRGQEFVVVVMGSKTKQQRLATARRLIQQQLSAIDQEIHRLTRS